MCIYSRVLTCSVLVRALSTGQPHSLSANGGVLHLEPSQYPFFGSSKREISGDFLGIITWRSDEFDNRLLIWDWKTGVLHVNMPLVRVPSTERMAFGGTFAFLDDRHFVISCVLIGRPGEIVLDVYPLFPQLGQQQAPAVIRSYVLSLPDVRIRALQLIPDESARGGAFPGHFYADASKRMFGIRVTVTFLSTNRTTWQEELLVPVQALKATMRAPQYRRVSRPCAPWLSPCLTYASRAAEERMPAEKLPPSLRGIDACLLRYAVCCGALLVFEVSCGSLPLRWRETIADFPAK